MNLNERLEQYRVSQIGYMRTRIAVLDCNISSLRGDIEFWSEPAETLSDEERSQVLETLNRLLERALREREYCRVRVGQYEGFDIIRSDVH